MANEYNGLYSSAGLSYDAKIIIGEDDVQMIGALEQSVIPYSEIASFDIQNHSIRIKTAYGFSMISKIGLQCEAFRDDLHSAFNRKVLKAFFIDSAPLFETRGEYEYAENGFSSSGNAMINLYGNCICLLPPSDLGRRIPLCFITDVKVGPIDVKVSMDNGDSYRLIRLGRELDPFVKALNAALMALRERTQSMVLSVCDSLDPRESISLAKIMSEGIAAPVGTLMGISLAFVKAAEGRISEGHASESYKALKGICDPLRICIGIKSKLAGESDKEGIIWIIAPGNSKNVAIVELAVSEDTAAATFIYEFGNDWDSFRKELNRAMEAIDFKREAIRLTEDELKMMRYSDYAMAVKRTHALRFIRKCFAGRVIHHSPESWERDMLKHLN